MRHRFLFVFLILAPVIVGAETLRYTVLLSGNKAGNQVVETADIGDLHITFEYNDRGRGPRLDARMTINADGIPVAVETTGNDYLKAPVVEKFEFRKNKASWKNVGEQGEKVIEGSAYYLSFNGVPQDLGLLAHALLKAPDQKMALLPEGEARIERIGERTVTADGVNSKVIHYAIAGLEFIPTQLWLDDSGILFASGNSWFSVIREGWESTLAELVQEQDAYQAQQSSRIAVRLAKKPESPIVIRGANVFDSEKGISHPGWSVLVSGNRILKVGPDPEISVDPDSRVIDAKGMTVLPGLWDMHVHLGDSDGPLHLAAGVTSVRDMANDIDKVLQLKKDYDSSAAIGPRVILAGFIDGPGPYQGPSKILAGNEKDARAFVDRYAELGYEQIKIYSSLKAELVPAIIEEAHKKGLRISGHIPAFMTAEQLIRMGLDEIQHVNFLILNFLPEVQDTRTPARFTAVAEHAAELDLKSRKVLDFISLLKERKTVLDPTLNVFESMFVDRPGKTSVSFAPVADRLPSQVRRGLLGGGLPVPEGMDQRYHDSLRAMSDFLKILYDAGITIVAGTDSLAGFALHHELEIYSQAGIPAPQVLQIATIVPARVMNRDTELGSIAPGKLADLVLIEGDPSKNISDIRNVRWVIKDGILFQASDLCAAAGIRP